IALSEYAGPGSGSSFLGGDNTQKLRRVYFKVVASNNYAGAPGDPMDFTTLGELPHSQYPPVLVVMQSQNPAGAGGYKYQYIPNANPTLANGTFQVLKGQAGPDIDIGAGAYPAGVTGDTIVGYADFIRL